MGNPQARLILASASPRRAALLREAGFDFEIRPSRAGEPPFAGGDIGDYVESLARRKAASVPGDLVLGADTVVAIDGDVLGKPADTGEAAAMLHRLSGRRHQVLTGVALREGATIRWGRAQSDVTFRKLAPAEILRYVATGEPMDKAGAYAIQGGAGAFVESVVGDRDTVIGLPMSLVRRLLAVSHPG